MRLLLTSSGLDTQKLRRKFSNMLERKTAEAKVAVIHAARKPEHLVYVNEVGKELNRLGILHPNVLYFNIAKDKSFPKLANYDAVYVCGGNTFYILDRMRRSGVEESIKKFVRTGGLYIGVSAGSIIAGGSIEIASWGREGDPNEINLRDLKGFCFTNITIFPHYKTKLKKEVNEFRNKVSYPVEPIKDGEAIVINGKSLSRIRKR